MVHLSFLPIARLINCFPMKIRLQLVEDFIPILLREKTTLYQHYPIRFSRWKEGPYMMYHYKGNFAYGINLVRSRSVPGYR